MRRALVYAVGAASLVASGQVRVGHAQPVPETWSGVPAQVIPLYPEVGAPTFTTPSGSSSFGSVPGAGGGTLGDGSSPTNGATAVSGSGGTLTYVNADGTTSTLSGGSLAWRDNNPGNIRAGAFATANGAIGKNDGFAVFPDLSSGTSALTSLLNGPGYQSLSVDSAIARYAPPNENNTSSYQAAVEAQMGVSGSTTLSSLTPVQMQVLQSSIQKQEGYTAGTVSNGGGNGHA